MTEQEIMLTSVLNCRRIDLYTQDQALSSEQERRLEEIRFRRAQGEPLQAIIGQTEFCGLSFCVDSHVLIPRPETELMVESVIDFIGDGNSETGGYAVLDIGTGSGCIAISLAKAFSQLRCLAVDISPDALTVAKKNANLHNVTKQVEFECADIGRLWKQLPAAAFDMIISNPPYIPEGKIPFLPKDVQWEPGMALGGGEDGLIFYRDFLANAPQVLKPGGVLVCEFWDGQDLMLEEMFDQHWQVAFYKDLSGVNRFLKAHYLP